MEDYSHAVIESVRLSDDICVFHTFDQDGFEAVIVQTPQWQDSPHMPITQELVDTMQQDLWILLGKPNLDMLHVSAGVVSLLTDNKSVSIIFDADYTQDVYDKLTDPSFVESFVEEYFLSLYWMFTYDGFTDGMDEHTLLEDCRHAIKFGYRQEVNMILEDISESMHEADVKMSRNVEMRLKLEGA